MTTRTNHLRDRLARRRAKAEAGLVAALDKLAAAQAELTEAVAAQILFENKRRMDADARIRQDNARSAARRDAARDMADEGVS